MKDSVLIADDESLARQTLRHHLLSLGWSGPIHEARDGVTAISIANRELPRLLFLDIVMPGATGLEVLERLTYEPRVIFTTAHDQYALVAFELGALDYLLKPFGRDRVERILRRAQGELSASASPLLTRARETLHEASSPSRIFVNDGNRIIPIPLATLERVQATDDYVTLCAQGKNHLVNLRLSDLEVRLEAANFLRIHRSHLINIEYVTSIEHFDSVRVQVVLRSGVRIVASRSGSKKLRDLAL